jgi:hypothetical protein
MQCGEYLQRAINEGRAHGCPPEVLTELRGLVEDLRRDLLREPLKDQ